MIKFNILCYSDFDAPFSDIRLQENVENVVTLKLEKNCNNIKIKEAKVMLTNPRDAFGGQPRYQT